MENLLQELNAAKLLAIAAIVVLASAVQSAVGFGAGLVAIPLLVWLGASLPAAIATMYGVVAIHTVYNLWLHHRRRQGSLPLRAALKMSWIRWAFMPVGVWLLHAQVARDNQITKLVVGVGLLLSLLLRQIVRPTPRPRVSFGWTLAAGSASGLLAGLVGMGGPPVVLYALAHDWPKERFRSYLWLLFFFGLPVGVGILYATFGALIAIHLAIGMLMTPCVWVGSELGLRGTQSWPASAVQRLATALLLALAASTLLAPWL